MINSSSANAVAQNIMAGQYNSVLDTGSINAYVAPATFYSDVSSIIFGGSPLNVFIANTNSGASTLTYSNMATLPIQLTSGAALSGGELVANGWAQLILNNAGSAWQLINPVTTPGITSAGITSGQILVATSGSSAASSSALSFDSSNANFQSGAINTFAGPNIFYSVIHGFSNSIINTGLYCSILGGNNNQLDAGNGNATVIVGGDHNSGGGLASAIVCGSNQVLNDPIRAIITHGHACSIQGDYSIAGGETCVANGSYSFAMGFHAQTNNNGSFVWADNSSASTFQDTSTNQFLVRAAGGFYFNIATSTTAARIDSSGNLINLLGTADQSYSLQAPSTGFSITIGAGVKTLLLNPSGSLLAGTIIMPAAPVDGQEIRVSSTQTITTLTVSPNSGQTISNAPVTITAGTGFAYIYNLSGTNWYRLY